MDNQDQSNESAPGYDLHITPAEVASRQKREGEDFHHTPHEFAARDDAETLRTTDGYTVDREGRLNNYAVEPEMYVNQPGDLREEEEEARVQRRHELEELQEDETGKLTMEHDLRHKGPGLI